MPDTLNCKAVYMTESKLLLNTTERRELSWINVLLYCVLTRGCMRQDTPSCHRKEIGEPTEVIVTYRKELSPRSKSDSRIFTLLSHRKRQVYLLLDTIWSTWTSRPLNDLTQQTKTATCPLILECCLCLLVSEALPHPTPHVCTLNQLDIVIWVVQWALEGFEFEVH